MGKPTQELQITKQEFLGNVVDKIGRQVYSSSAYLNPLSRFKKGFIENASDIEEIYVARIAGTVQDYDGADTLKRIKPTVKTQYHKQNFGKCYTASISDKQVRKGFRTQEGVKKLADEIISQQKTGYEYDEFVEMKKNICDLIEGTPYKKVIAEPSNQTTAKAFVKQVRKDIKEMQFRGTKFATVERNCSSKDLVLVTKVGVMDEIDVELLATAFNTSKTDLAQLHIVEIDNFPDNENVFAMLLEENALMVFDTLYNLEPQRNAKGMFTNYHLNVEKILSTSNMYNVAVYKSK